MARLAADDDIANVLHYDISNRILSVEEPQLIFYVRHLDWSEFVRQIGFTRIDIAQPYDFAFRSPARTGRSRMPWSSLPTAIARLSGERTNSWIGWVRQQSAAAVG